MSRTCSIDGCTSPSSCRGWCKMHHKRWMRHGDPHVTLIAPKGDRLRTLHVLLAVQTDDCVLWPYTPTANGYGNVTINNRAVSVHVLACTAAHGPRPFGMEAAHRCGVRACVNGRHLRWATSVDNAADRVLHGTVLIGDNHPNSKLTAAGVLEIRRRRGEGESLSLLSRDFGVSRSTLRSAIKGSTWSHVPIYEIAEVSA